MPSKRIRLEGCPCPRDPQATGRGWISAQTGWPQVPERALGSHTEPQELTFFSRLLGHQTCGLALEHLLQVTYRPVMTARRRNGAGEWTPRRIESSRSRGAVISDRLPGLFMTVRAVWDKLANMPGPGGGNPSIHAGPGRVIFPELVLKKSERPRSPSFPQAGSSG